MQADDPKTELWAAVAIFVTSVLAGLGLLARRWLAELTEAGTELLRRWFKSRARCHQEKYGDGLVRWGRLLAVVARIGELEAVQRVILLFGYDSGGLPDPTRPYTVRAQHGWAEEGHPDPVELYHHGLQVDAAYCAMMGELVREGRVILTTALMPSCMLKRYYLAEGVHQSAIYLLHLSSEDNVLMFLSIASYKRPFSEQELGILDMRVDVMRAICAGEAGGSSVHETLR